jgi:hypothetical protein
VDKLSDKVIEILCAEWRPGVSLRSSEIYTRLIEDGVEVPDYAMSEVLEALNGGGLIKVPFDRPGEDAKRRHGDLTITYVDPHLCEA